MFEGNVGRALPDMPALRLSKSPGKAHTKGYGLTIGQASCHFGYGWGGAVAAAKNREDSPLLQGRPGRLGFAVRPRAGGRGCTVAGGDRPKKCRYLCLRGPGRERAAAAVVRCFIFVNPVKNGDESTTAAIADAPAPQDPCGISKMENEKGLRQASAEAGMEVVVVRSALFYGSGVKANLASMLRVVQRDMLSANVTHSRRSFVALNNRVDRLIPCIDHPAVANQIFLVGNGEDLFTADLLCCLGHVTGKPVWLFPAPPALLQLGANQLGKEDMAQRLLGKLQVAIDCTRNTINWIPPISMEEGMWRSVAGFTP